jgi:hypothetical protein
MNTYNYSYKVCKQKLTLSVNRGLVTSAKEKRIKLSAFLEAKLLEQLTVDNNQCGGQEFITDSLVKVTQQDYIKGYF